MLGSVLFYLLSHKYVCGFPTMPKAKHLVIHYRDAGLIPYIFLEKKNPFGNEIMFIITLR